MNLSKVGVNYILFAIIATLNIWVEWFIDLLWREEFQICTPPIRFHGLESFKNLANPGEDSVEFPFQSFGYFKNKFYYIFSIQGNYRYCQNPIKLDSNVLELKSAIRFKSLHIYFKTWGGGQ